MKEKPLADWGKKNGYPYSIIGIMKAEGGSRGKGKCMSYHNGKLKAFQPLIPLTKEWEEWFIYEYNIRIPDLYYPPYNFDRTGCKGCPFNVHLQEELDTLEKFFPREREQCEIIWKPVYDEYRRLGYRLKDR
jgi:3'-phosphoadenosine 5'-phosphosulfate sulfotransferase (PAPS reductase)/FAD synthetase